MRGSDVDAFRASACLGEVGGWRMARVVLTNIYSSVPTRIMWQPSLMMMADRCIRYNVYQQRGGRNILYSSQ